jgi:DNA-binding transcriptional LysR family regulator
MASTLNLKLLEHFVALMRHGSFKAAADFLGVSQSTVTKSISKLEARTQVRLFNRTTRKVEPTDTARQLLQSAESALQSMRVFEEESRLLAAGDLGTLRVGAIALASEVLIADTLAYLSQHNPELEIEVVVGSADIYRDLATGVCDVAIGDEANFTDSVYAKSLRMVPIRTESIVLAHRTKHPCANNFSELAQYPLALPSRYYNENRLFRAFRTQGGPKAARYRLNNLSSCLALAARSDNITLAPASAIENSKLPLTGSPKNLQMDIHLALVTVAEYAPTPAMRAFQTALHSP